MENKKNILIVTQNFYPETFGINDIAEDMAKRGHRVDVLTGLPNYPQGKFFDGYSVFRRGPRTYRGVRLHRCMVFPRMRNSALGICLNYASFAIAATIRSIPLIFTRYDRILVYEPSPLFQSIPAQFVGIFNRCQKVIYVLDIWPESVYSVVDFQSPTIRRMLKSYSKRTYKKYDKLLITSKGFRQPLMEYGIEQERIEYLPQWVAPYSDTHIQTEKRYEDTFNIVFTGNVGIPQNLGIIVEAMEHIESHRDMRVIVVGDGDYLPSMIESVEAHGLEDVFVFVGRRPFDEMPSYYDIADALLCSLKDIELFAKIVPAKIQAYMMAAKPILCSISGEGAELVAEAKCGLTSPAGDAKALSESIVALYNMPIEQRATLGANGRAYAQEHFCRDVLLDRIEEILTK